MILSAVHSGNHREPVRIYSLIPGFDEVKKRSKEAGALGGIMVVVAGYLYVQVKMLQLQAVAKEMADVFIKIGIDYHTHVTTINQQGVKVVSE